MVPPGRPTGGEPDLADGAWRLADDSAGEQGLKRREDLGVEAAPEGLYQGGERGDKLVHRAGLRAARVSGVVKQPQDTKSVRMARSCISGGCCESPKG